AATATTVVAAGRPALLSGGAGRGLRLALGPRAGHLPLVDPDLHPHPAGRPVLRGAAGRGLRLALGPRAGHVTLVDPDLHADPAEGRTGLVEAVVDVRAQRVQRHPALAVELRPRHLGATEPAGALDPDAQGAATHGGLHRLAHRAA